LYWAARHGHFEVVKLLLDAHAEANSKTLHEWTPLHSAAYSGQLEVVKLLLDGHAEVE
jgi:ankyrin repeat protein